MFHVTSTRRLSPTTFCSLGDVIWQIADDELVERTITHMTDDLKFISGIEVLAGFAVRARRAYPSYGLGYEEPLQVGRQFIGA
ncbi:MAG: hypothetical protein M3541_04955 [Acidobacteriota bacterium]|nr:hypothetical protein [Acidobacteriota bacterium]